MKDEEKYANITDMVRNDTTLISQLTQSNANLEEKLVEKDKEIEKLKTILNMQAIQVSEEQRLSLISTNCIQYNQYRIAIEQLEKLKIKLHCLHTDRYLTLIDEEIDNQINKLKGGEE